MSPSTIMSPKNLSTHGNHVSLPSPQKLHGGRLSNKQRLQPAAAREDGPEHLKDGTPSSTQAKKTKIIASKRGNLPVASARIRSTLYREVSLISLSTPSSAQHRIPPGCSKRTTADYRGIATDEVSTPPLRHHTRLVYCVKGRVSKDLFDSAAMLKSGQAATVLRCEDRAVSEIDCK